jgi:hypothetical protein
MLLSRDKSSVLVNFKGRGIALSFRHSVLLPYSFVTVLSETENSSFYVAQPIKCLPLLSTEDGTTFGSRNVVSF